MKGSTPVTPPVSHNPNVNAVLAAMNKKYTPADYSTTPTSQTRHIVDDFDTDEDY